MNMSNKMKNFLTQMATKAGKILLDGYRKPKQITSKGDEGIVTDTDFRSEKFLVNTIKTAYPEHSIMAEESGITRSDSEWLWLIDPLDGTTNFSQKLPLFCVSIALAHNDQLQYGIVYSPILDEMFYAEKGNGAYLNGSKIKVSNKTDFNKALLCTGFAYDRGKIMYRNLENMGAIMENRITQGVRIDGSAAMDLCYVACGRFDGFWEFNLRPWDLAAGALIVREAGGTVSKLAGEWSINDREIVCSNGIFHKKILGKIK
jgi:myo-inositol-1(or 4)-monophosphatase